MFSILKETKTIAGNCKGEDGKQVDESICDDDKLWQQQHVCPCQKMMLWAENWLPCRKKDTEEPIPICGSLGRRMSSSKRLPKNLCSCQQGSNRTQEEVTARREPRHRHPKDDSSGSEQSRVSINSRESGYQSSESKETDNDSDIAKDLENYANIEFVDSLQLYENTSNVLAKAGINPDEGEGGEKPVLPVKSPALSKRLPPLPPSSSRTVRSTCSNCCTNNTPEQPCHVPNYSMKIAQEGSDDVDNDNYLEMQPIMFDASKDRTNISGDYQTMYDQPEPLPLRPFLPYELSQAAPLNSHEEKVLADYSGGSVTSSPMLNKRILQKLQSKSVRSNSLAEINRNTLLKRRSTSVDSLEDRRLDGSDDDDVEDCSRTLTKKRSPSRKQSLLSKFSLRNKHKCKSSDELSPQSDRNRELLVKRTHYSVEFLNVGQRGGDDANGNDDDPCKCRRHNSVDGAEDDFPMTIKRSSSVPSKPALMDAAASPSDSGISTSFSGRQSTESYIEMQRHKSLPRRLKKDKVVCHLHHDERSQDAGKSTIF